ncbi:hypothetical protein LTR37_016655 [Vermiconidia calcicola]|uniref:Uncharacterized protein n=1 Tax=Vermiconidia calcicola TaxID=1690605 RepID=A0ACC3MMB7_9PEZI|nr:hypothetical protein LTR37_016655 [Vermiconidia calcicola]
MAPGYIPAGKRPLAGNQNQRGFRPGSNAPVPQPFYPQMQQVNYNPPQYGQHPQQFHPQPNLAANINGLQYTQQGAAVPMEYMQYAPGNVGYAASPYGGAMPPQFNNQYVGNIPDPAAENHGFDKAYQTSNQATIRPPNMQQPKFFRTQKATYRIGRWLVAPSNEARMSFGVRMVHHTESNEVRVEKRLRVDEEGSRERAFIERNAMMQLRKAGRHPNINYLHDCFQIPCSPLVSLIVEFCDRGTLEDERMDLDLQGKWAPEAWIWHIFSSLCSALAMIHYGLRDPFDKEHKMTNWNTICHLDIKLLNVFVSRKSDSGHDMGNRFSRIVLGDFGCAVTKEDIESSKFARDSVPCGTRGWFPPELVENVTGWSGNYGKPTDVWQMGGVIQTMCTRLVQPSQGPVRKGLPCGNGYSKELNHLVMEIMGKNDEYRPSAVDVAELVKRDMGILGLF